jgi:hypothetical protein
MEYYIPDVMVLNVQIFTIWPFIENVLTLGLKFPKVTGIKKATCRLARNLSRGERNSSTFMDIAEKTGREKYLGFDFLPSD